MVKQRIASHHGWRTASLVLFSAGLLHAQLSTSAYRVLGQMDLRHNGVNLVQGTELYAPSALAIDSRNGQAHLYISDTRNSRILAWQDARSYQTGDAPALVLGQPGPQYSGAMGIGVKGLNSPLGLAVDPSNGNLYVADYGNHRVVRFPAPFANPTRVEPDAVYGQPGFTTRTAGLSRSSMNRPRGVAFDPNGNLWVADSGNHRVLRFSASGLDSPVPPDADLVVGQKDFLSGGANRGGNISALGLDTPAALVFDGQGNLYIADYNNTRVVKFAPPLGPETAAASVFGQPDFGVRGVSQPSASTLAGPSGLAIDSAGNLYVAVPNDNRVLIFPSAGGSAKNVLGQADFTSITANALVFPKASPNTLSSPADVKVDSDGNVYVADSGNHRVIAFPANSKSATRIWGQPDFNANTANQIKPGSLNSPFKVAIDYSQAPYALYISDTANHRVLAWRDSTRFRNGDPADFVIGQPDLRSAIPNIDSRGGQNPSNTSLSSPAGIVVDPRNGALYVADSANHRVLRFPRPASQSGRITPDAVIGQIDFNTSTSAAVSAASLRLPTGLALGPDGSLIVADTGNHRVLEFPVGAGTRATAVRVYGQPNFTSSAQPGQSSGQTLTSPTGVFVDSAFNLYVADTGANRVLVFPNTQSAPPAGAAAAFVIGQSRFDAAGEAQLSRPSDVATDSAGSIYVSDSGHNRVLAFPSLVFLPVSGASPEGVVGQREVNGTSPNWNSTDGLATAEGLYSPVGIYFDRQDTLYVGDIGNNRVVHLLKAAAIVNAASLQGGAPVAPGAIVTLSGASVADETASTTAAPWPATLAKREVVVNDEIRAPLRSVSSSQVSFQVPSLAPLGVNRVAVRLSETGELVAGGNMLVSASSPGLFSANEDGRGQGNILNEDGRANGPSNPAAKGSVVTIFGTGQGQVSPLVPDGTAAPSEPMAQTVAVPTSDGKACLVSQPAVCAAVGSGFGDIQFSGLAPGSVGIWQIKVRIPQDAPSGNVPVRVLINGTPSNIVNVAVR